jgi:hypothetical protein
VLPISLKRDRATLVRALRRVPADGYTKHGQPRWRMPTIINALAVKPQARRETGKFRDRYSLRSTKLDRMRLEYEKGLALIGAEPSLHKRLMALQLAPLLEQYQTTYLEIGRSLHIADDDVLIARSDLIWSEMMDEVSAAGFVKHSNLGPIYKVHQDEGWYLHQPTRCGKVVSTKRGMRLFLWQSEQYQPSGYAQRATFLSFHLILSFPHGTLVSTASCTADLG